MTTRLCLIGLVVAVVGLVQVGAQAPQELGTLTVPGAKLPAGCALQPIDMSRTMMLPDGKVLSVAAPGQAPSNPWTGTNNALRTAARQAVEGQSRAVRLPDGPPPSLEQMAAWDAKRLADIAEGYLATYGSEGKAFVRVAAVRYVDPRPAMNPDPDRLILGSTVVRVTGPTTSACYRAIWRHLESLR